MPSFKMKFSGVTILQGVEFSIFPIDFEWALQQCSATALPVIHIRWGQDWTNQFTAARDDETAMWPLPNYYNRWAIAEVMIKSRAVLFLYNRDQWLWCQTVQIYNQQMSTLASEEFIIRWISIPQRRRGCLHYLDVLLWPWPLTSKI